MTYASCGAFKGHFEDPRKHQLAMKGTDRERNQKSTRALAGSGPE